MGTGAYANVYGAAPYSSANFPAIAKEIEEAAYLMYYEGTLLPKLVKPIGTGQKGTAIHWPYFDPTALVTATGWSGALTETTDITSRVDLTNASVYVIASEFGVQSFVTDTLLESGSFDFKGELTRQLGIGMGRQLELHILAKMNVTSTTYGGFHVVTATDTTNGLSYSKIAAFKSLLDAKLVQAQGTKSLVTTDYGYFYTAKGTYSTTYAAALPTPGEEVLKNWYITTAFGDVAIYRNNYITVAASACTSFIFVKDAVGLWQPRDFRVETERDASKRGEEFNASMRAGAKVLVHDWGYRIKTAAGSPDKLV